MAWRHTLTHGIPRPIAARQLILLLLLPCIRTDASRRNTSSVQWPGSIGFCSAADSTQNSLLMEVIPDANSILGYKSRFLRMECCRRRRWVIPHNGRGHGSSNHA